jgi:hypothetical protein
MFSVSREPITRDRYAVEERQPSRDAIIDLAQANICHEFARCSSTVATLCGSDIARLEICSY